MSRLNQKLTHNYKISQLFFIKKTALFLSRKLNERAVWRTIAQHLLH